MTKFCKYRSIRVEVTQEVIRAIGTPGPIAILDKQCSGIDLKLCPVECKFLSLGGKDPFIA